jgi:cytochrome c
MLQRALALAGLTLVIASGAASGAGAAPAASKEPVLRGDPKAGEAIYARCLACHAVSYDRTGPRHCGLFGRRAGTVKGFAYSEAMKRSRIVWIEATLDRFLANPMAAVPGTAMGYAGVVDRKERSDLVAYLRQVNESPQCAK